MAASVKTWRVIFFVLLACSAASLLGSGACHAPPPFLGDHIRHPKVWKRLVRESRLQWTGFQSRARSLLSPISRWHEAWKDFDVLGTLELANHRTRGYDSLRRSKTVFVESCRASVQQFSGGTIFRYIDLRVQNSALYGTVCSALNNSSGRQWLWSQDRCRPVLTVGPAFDLMTPEQHGCRANSSAVEEFCICEGEEIWTPQRIDQYEESYFPARVPEQSSNDVELASHLHESPTCLVPGHSTVFARHSAAGLEEDQCRGDCVTGQFNDLANDTARAGAAMGPPSVEHRRHDLSVNTTDRTRPANDAGAFSCRSLEPWLDTLGDVDCGGTSMGWVLTHSSHDMQVEFSLYGVARSLERYPAFLHRVFHPLTQLWVDHSRTHISAHLDTQLGLTAFRKSWLTTTSRLGQTVLQMALFGTVTGLVISLVICVAADTAIETQDVLDDSGSMPSQTHDTRSVGFTKISALVLVLAVVSTSAIFCHMFAGQGNLLRTPPLWSIASDMEPARKAASVMLVLKGAAKELARQIPPQAVVDGGVVNGVAVDPLTYLMHALQEHFGNLGEEVRVQAITELMGFTRNGNEPIDSLLVRFDSVRTRAAEQGGAIVSIQGVTWILLRAVGITDQQLLQLLSPFNGLFPSTEAEFTQLKTSLRRMGHILERAPGNLREGLRTATSHSAHTAFLAQEESWEPASWQTEELSGSWSPWLSGQHAFATRASAHPQMSDAYHAFEDEDIVTDSDTSSGSASSVELDASQDPSRVAQDLFWAYRTAKHKWRKFMQKGTRTVRRYVKRFTRRKGKGKGFKGKGKNSSATFTVGKGKGQKGKHPVTALLADMNDMEVQEAMPAFRGHRSPGKGKGRRGNPKDLDGQTMRCYECGSTEHLAGSCPRRHASGGNSQPTTFFANHAMSTVVEDEGPLAGIITNEADLSSQALSRPQIVTFAMNTDEADQSRRVHNVYMTQEAQADEEDPFMQQDPWSAATSQSWSLPVSMPRSFGPPAPTEPNASRGFFGFPFGNLGFRRSVAASEPVRQASRSPSESSAYGPARTVRSSRQESNQTEPHRVQPASQPAGTSPTPPPPSHPSHPPSMNWAAMARMPEELRELLPWPIVSALPPMPSVPDFAMRPEFEFLNMSQPPELPSPPTLREAQVSRIEGPLRSQIDDFHYVQQHIANRRHQHLPSFSMNRPAVQVHSQLDPQYRPQLNEFHQVQRQVERYRQQKQVHRSKVRDINTEDVEYDGASDMCPLCRESFETNESVLRLVCRHLFHVECWTTYMCQGEAIVCPVCRGGCHVVARYRIPLAEPTRRGPQSSHVSSRPVTPDRSTPQPDSYNIFTPLGHSPQPAIGPQNLGTPFMSPAEEADPDPLGTFPWWPGEDVAPAEAYHSISLPNRSGIIIDPGAYTNLIGENTARAFAKMALAQGHRPRQWKMKPMYVQGVGEGQQKCEWTVSIPIACKLSIDGKRCCLNAFEAPVVGGSGARLPALLGLKSLSALSATLSMSPGNETLFVPLPGAKHEDFTSCRRRPLSKAPSGHLIMTIDHWDELKQDSQVGVQPEPMILHVDPKGSVEAESSQPASSL